MKKKIIYLLLFFTTNIFAQEVLEKEVSSFDEIKVFGNVKIILDDEDDEEKIKIETQGIKPEAVTAEVSGKVLKLKNEKYKDGEVKVEVTVSYKALRVIKASAGATVYANHVIEGDKLELSAVSGAEVELSLDVKALDLNATSGGKMVLKGKTDSQKINVNTGGEIKAFMLDCNETYIKMSAGNFAEVVARKKIDVSVSMKGEVRYKGNPGEVTESTSLGGKITKIN